MKGLPGDAGVEDFKDGKKLVLSGSAPLDKVDLLITFNSEMRKATLKDQPLFSKVESITYRQDPGSAAVSWNFSCELNRVEVTQ